MENVFEVGKTPSFPDVFHILWIMLVNLTYPGNSEAKRLKISDKCLF